MGQRVIGNLHRSLYNVDHLYSTVTFGAAGVVGSQTAEIDSGMVVTKVAAEAGRYLVTLHRDFPLLAGVSAIVVGPADVALSGGFIPSVRNINVGTGTRAGTFEIQLSDAAAADVEPTNGNKLIISVAVQSQAVR